MPRRPSDNPSPAALKQRRYRERRALGEIAVIVALPEDAILDLVHIGRLDPATLKDKESLGLALRDVIEASTDL
jgi:hypothetical protein